MANRWGKNGNSDRLYLGGGSKITADGDCSHKIKRCLLLERKALTNLDSMLKSRDITLPTKVHLVKGMVSPVVMYGCESWTTKKAVHWRIDAFELWCWRRLLKVPWTARRSNQWIPKEISPEYSLEGLMLKLKLHYFSHLMWRTDSLKKTLMLGKNEDRRRRGWQRVRWLDNITNSMQMSLSELGVEGQGSLACCSQWGCKELDTTEPLHWLNNRRLKEQGMPIVTPHFANDAARLLNKNFTAHPSKTPAEVQTETCTLFTPRTINLESWIVSIIVDGDCDLWQLKDKNYDWT